jgi:hypothetical protein
MWMLHLNPNRSVADQQKISSTEGTFAGSLENGDRFGVSISPLGDLDGNGVSDFAVGAHQSDDGGPNRGATWILFGERSTR